MNRSLGIKLGPMIGAIIASMSVSGQIPVSIQEQQNIEYSRVAPSATEQQWDSINHYQPQIAIKNKIAAQCQLKKVVFGWHPHWNGTYYNEYNFSLLSDIAYFSYEVDPATGSYSTIYSWKNTPMVDLAKAAGTRVSLAVTLFSGHNTFFGNPTSRQTLIDSLVGLVKLRGAQGVNIDFEAVPSSQRDNLTQFMKDLGTRFHVEIPGSVISIALPSVDWNKTFDVLAMLPYVDLFIIMGYDYYYGGGSKAGPVSPKNNGQLWTPYDVTRSVRYYLQTGIPGTKLCLGVPYYGYDWPTSDSLLNSNTTGAGTARIYKDAIASASDNGRLWDRNASVPYYMYHNGSAWRQCWYDDETSLGYKYDMVNMYNIAGIGIWALGYDRTKQELWNLLSEKFSNCGNTACKGSFTDMGGPQGNYFASDDYTFTLTQRDTGYLSTVFTNFSLAATDTLYSYNGKTAQNPVIGKLSGSQNPGVITSKNGGITFRFISGKSQNQSGWEAYWNCGETLSPETLKLDGDSVAENLPAGSFIGRLQVSDTLTAGCQLAPATCITYSLYGNDNPDHSYFRISGDSLLSAKTFNYDKQNKFHITISGEDWKKRNVLNSFDIKVIDQTGTSISAYPSAAGIKIFPNPTTGIIKLIIPFELKVSYIEIFDCKGVKIRKTEVLNDKNTSYDLSFLSDGLYILKLYAGNKVLTKKIVIIK